MGSIQGGQHVYEGCRPGTGEGFCPGRVKFLFEIPVCERESEQEGADNGESDWKLSQKRLSMEPTFGGAEARSKAATFFDIN